MESGTQISEYHTTSSAQPGSTPEDQSRQRKILIGLAIAAVVFLVLLVLAVIYLLNPSTPTEKIRDVFIIFMALESLVLGLALVILIVQLARLINLLQNEIKPILESTNETVSTLRGTTTFLSDNLVGPVIKLNEYLAALQQMFKVVGFGRGGKNQSNNRGV
jgi:predicted tellurium resistance membrane protein TerC